MTIDPKRLAQEIVPANTVLLFGAGSSVPSHAPTSARLTKLITDGLGEDFSQTNLNLAEVASIAEAKKSRRWLIETIRPLFSGLTPTRGLRNLPLYDWKSIYTTNYDTLIEESYALAGKPLKPCSSNFDFSQQAGVNTARLYKLHGTIDKDAAFGDLSQLVITDGDYDITQEYREHLYNGLKAELATCDLVIIGHSLADPDIKDLIKEVLSIREKSRSTSRVFLFLFSGDPYRAQLFEQKGYKVCFGGIDDFFLSLAPQIHTASSLAASDDPLDHASDVRPVTLDVQHSLKTGRSDVSAMFSGWPASHPDIANNLTFSRSVANDIASELRTSEKWCAVLTGPGGVGKTTAARQAMQRLKAEGYWCWEHLDDYNLSPNAWRSIGRKLSAANQLGVLFIDDAHNHLFEVNTLVDLLASDTVTNLKIILTSPKHQWDPRVKTPNLFKHGKAFQLHQLNDGELEGLLSLIDTNAEIRPLIENSFAGFSRNERKRRLAAKCENDNFVCLKNIFASEKFDDIILREFADLTPEYQSIYRLVAAMEASGIRVHRQLVIRLLGIPADAISSALVHLRDIIREYEISKRDGIYGWRGRHEVITKIVTDHKFSDMNELANLYEKIIDNTLPTYEVEVKSLRSLCGEFGISRIPTVAVRNTLLRKIISVVPGERVPRHRLIRNLIEMEEFLEKADTEIRLFENDFRADGPVFRYKILLLLARATHTKGIMTEDRLSILRKAEALAQQGIQRFEWNKDILRAYCDVGIEYYRHSGNLTVFDAGMDAMRSAEERIGDPDITRLITVYERRVAGQELRNTSALAAAELEQ